jgi:TonB family protein
LLASLHALAANVKVIANPNIRIDTISTGEIKRIFLLEGNSLHDGTHIEPVLEKSGQVHETFLREFLNTNDPTLRTYYGTLVFTGKGSMPKELASDADVVGYVARTKGAIGYVSADTNTKGVKTLAVVNPPNGTQRTLIWQVEPEYPETLKRLNIGGTVRLQVTISAKGNVENVQLLGGNPILAESAIFAVKRWVYSVSHLRTTTEVDIPFDAHP